MKTKKMNDKKFSFCKRFFAKAHLSTFGLLPAQNPTQKNRKSLNLSIHKIIRSLN